MRRLRSQSGVTYLEILILVVAAGIISSLFVPRWTEEVKEQRYESAFAVAEQLATTLESYYASHGNFTNEPDSLTAILPSTDLLINPLTGGEWNIEIMNAGQEFMITGEGRQRIELQTEDRWPEFKQAWEAWVAYQEQLRQEAARSRRGR